MKRTATKTKQQPVPRPSAEELNKAFEVVDAHFMHFYQLLWFAEPKLTQPGDGHGRPFNLRPSTKHRHCIEVQCQPWSGRREEFDFLIAPNMTDETVLDLCGVILEAINSGKKKVHDMACCALAKQTNCVCAYSFKCVLHGEKHVGTHD